MTTKVDNTPLFARDLRRLGKKYTQIVREVDDLITQLEQDERPGDKIPNVGHDVYKVRWRNHPLDTVKEVAYARFIMFGGRIMCYCSLYIPRVSKKTFPQREYAVSLRNTVKQ